MLARDLMNKPAITVRETATLQEAARQMIDARIGCLPVVDTDGKLCGIITESDFTAKRRGVPFSTLMLPQLFGQWLGDDVKAIFEQGRQMQVGEIMSREVISVDENDSVEQVLRTMLEHERRRIPVVQDGAPTGIITRRDLLRCVAGDTPLS